MEFEVAFSFISIQSSVRYKVAASNTGLIKSTEMELNGFQNSLPRLHARNLKSVVGVSVSELCWSRSYFLFVSIF